MLNLEQMYPAIETKVTYTSGAISASSTNITVADGTVFPPGPNKATLDDDEHAEVVIYQSLYGNILVNCQRGADGTIARAWPLDTAIARTQTAGDLNAVQNNISMIADTGISRAIPFSIPVSAWVDSTTYPGLFYEANLSTPGVSPDDLVRATIEDRESFNLAEETGVSVLGDTVLNGTVFYAEIKPDSAIRGIYTVHRRAE